MGSELAESEHGSIYRQEKWLRRGFPQDFAMIFSIFSNLVSISRNVRNKF